MKRWRALTGRSPKHANLLTLGTVLTEGQHDSLGKSRVNEGQWRDQELALARQYFDEPHPALAGVIRSEADDKARLAMRRRERDDRRRRQARALAELNGHPVIRSEQGLLCAFRNVDPE